MMKLRVRLTDAPLSFSSCPHCICRLQQGILVPVQSPVSLMICLLHLFLRPHFAFSLKTLVIVDRVAIRCHCIQSYSGMCLMKCLHGLRSAQGSSLCCRLGGDQTSRVRETSAACDCDWWLELLCACRLCDDQTSWVREAGVACERESWSKLLCACRLGDDPAYVELLLP